MPKSLEDVSWVEAQATAHITVNRSPMNVNEIHLVNLQDPEIRGLINANLLVVVDEETRKLLPPPTVPAAGTSGCGCGQ